MPEDTELKQIKSAPDNKEGASSQDDARKNVSASDAQTPSRAKDSKVECKAKKSEAGRSYGGAQRLLTISTIASAVATVLVAGLTAVYVYYARQQWTVMAGQLSAMRDQSTIIHDQLIAAKNANEISSSALAAAVGASVYIGHSEFRMLTEANETNKITVTAAIANEGGTTTRGLSYTTTCTDFAKPPADPFNYARLYVTRVHNLTLGPKESIKPIICSFGIREWARITAEHGSIYVYGRASYRDTVNPAEFHHLEFCSRLYDLSFTTSAFNPGPYSHGEECEHHNCSDAECRAS